MIVQAFVPIGSPAALLTERSSNATLDIESTRDSLLTGGTRNGKLLITTSGTPYNGL